MICNIFREGYQLAIFVDSSTNSFYKYVTQLLITTYSASAHFIPLDKIIHIFKLHANTRTYHPGPCLQNIFAHLQKILDKKTISSIFFRDDIIARVSCCFFGLIYSFLQMIPAFPVMPNAEGILSGINSIPSSFVTWGSLLAVFICF